MTTKMKISLVAVMAVAGILLILGSSMVNAVEPIKLSDEMKQKISTMPTERQSHMEEIFKLLIEKERSENTSDIERIDSLIEAEYAKMSASEEKARPQYNDHPQLRMIQQDLRNLDNIPLETTLVGKNTLTVVLTPGNENKGYEEIIAKYIPDKRIDVEIEYGVVGELIEWACNDRDDECDPLRGGLQIEKDASGYCTLGLPVKQEVQLDI